MKEVIVCTSVSHGNTKRVAEAMGQVLEAPVVAPEQVVDTFSCRGFATWLPFKLVGGVRKGRPNATDLAAARTFAAFVGAGG